MSDRVNVGDLQGFSPAPHDSPQVWKTFVTADRVSRFPRLLSCGEPVDNSRLEWSGYTRPRPDPMWPNLFHGTHETDLSAERTQAGEEAWLPQPHVDPRRPHDPEAPSRQGPQAPLGVGPLQRRNRLSRSRDFDAVYRQGRSASTRFLTLYWFQRDETVGEPRLGFAVPKAVGNAPVRNRIKRQLREIVRGRLERIPAANDYVVVVRQGLPEAAEANGFDWLESRVDELLEKASLGKAA